MTTPKDIQSDLEVMSNPSNWFYMFLPIKNIKEERVGIMLEGYGPKVFLHNMWNYPTPISKMEFIEFNSFQDILNAGWEVD